jgi:hypothetical protein
VSELLLDAAGRSFSPATLPQFDAGRRGATRDPLPDPPRSRRASPLEGRRCSSVGSAPEVAISIAPALSLESRATGRQLGGFPVMPTIVGARGTAVDTSRADA